MVGAQIMQVPRIRVDFAIDITVILIFGLIPQKIRIIRVHMIGSKVSGCPGRGCRHMHRIYRHQIFLLKRLIRMGKRIGRQPIRKSNRMLPAIPDFLMSQNIQHRGKPALKWRSMLLCCEVIPFKRSHIRVLRIGNLNCIRKPLRPHNPA
ncbi:hypothetical protein D3C75_676190 [compost metagenome]